MIGQDVLLNADYPRIALALLEESGLPKAKVIRELALPGDDIMTQAQIPVAYYYRIIEYGRTNVAEFSNKMALRCGVNTLGPLLLPVMSGRCAREALLILATYIPEVDRTVSTRIIESSDGMTIEIMHTAMSDANAMDFALAAFHITASVVGAGLCSIDFDVHADYYNMGPLPEPHLRWGSHMAKTDDKHRRVELFFPAQVVDKPWPQNNEERLRAEIEKVDALFAEINVKPSLKTKLEKAYASSDVRSGKPMHLPEQTCEYFGMTREAIDARLKKHDTSLKKIWTHYAVRFAVVLTQETDKSISEINDLTLQVSSTSNFTRIIKQHTGLTFTEIREGGVVKN